ncbi:hypothetical protein [Photobacterium carnosum]|uniref:hypothetical protein n=1 Tax=Photobacterium carnosum TaxID=2023717 RepID=UPI001E63DEA1|nr:hypothetical protein [Photobacterium carnosum]MCD9497598.1 hypothetical protein [Photobacterium carnosum]
MSQIIQKVDGINFLKAFAVYEDKQGREDNVATIKASIDSFLKQDFITFVLSKNEHGQFVLGVNK